VSLADLSRDFNGRYDNHLHTRPAHEHD